MKAQAEYSVRKHAPIRDAMNAYETALMMPDDGTFTLPVWFVREVLEEYLNARHLSDLAKEGGRF
jgi:hypothetical protein